MPSEKPFVSFTIILAIASLLFFFGTQTAEALTILDPGYRVITLAKGSPLPGCNGRPLFCQFCIPNRPQNLQNLHIRSPLCWSVLSRRYHGR
jgi:hypothetical protein